MTDVFPRRNLPEEAEQWGRAHDDRVISLEQQVGILSQSLSGQNRNSSSSIQTLADQVKDLTGRTSYNVGTAETQTWTTPTGTPYTWGPSLSFTLTEARVVSLQAIVAAAVSTIATSTTTASFAYLGGAIFVNGSLAAGSRGELSTNVGVAPNTSRSSYLTASIISRTLMPLPAGTHTVQGGFFSRDASVSGGTGSAYVLAKNPFVFVDVLQPA